VPPADQQALFFMVNANDPDVLPPVLDLNETRLAHLSGVIPRLCRR
jgi:hypothetical protein